MSRSSYQNPKVSTRKSARGPQYFIRYRVWVITSKDGRPLKERRFKHHALGLVSEMTKTQAKEAAGVIMSKVNGHGAMLQSHIPFEEFLAVYRAEHYRGIKAVSQDDYDDRINSWILPAFKGMKMCDIGSLEVTQLLGEMERANVARSTRRVTRSVVHSMFKRARKWGFLEKGAENPADEAEVGRSKGNSIEKWTPTMEEAQAIIAATDEVTGLILWFIIWTGMRISEVIGLRCKNVDLAEGVVYVRERSVGGELDDPKSQKGNRKLALGYLAAELAPLMGAPDDFLFRGGPPRKATGKLTAEQRAEIVRRRDAGENTKALAAEFSVSVTTINATVRVENLPSGACTNMTFYFRVRAAMESLGLWHKGNMYHAFRRLHTGIMAENLHSASAVFDLQKQLGHANVATTALYMSDNIAARKTALAAAQSNVVPIRRKA